MDRATPTVHRSIVDRVVAMAEVLTKVGTNRLCGARNLTAGAEK
jgi:hypothetical protein